MMHTRFGQEIQPDRDNETPALPQGIHSHQSLHRQMAPVPARLIPPRDMQHEQQGIALLWNGRVDAADEHFAARKDEDPHNALHYAEVSMPNSHAMTDQA